MDNKLDQNKNIKKAAKIALSAGSVGVAVGGLVLATVSTGGLALPLIGSALISAGVSSTIHTIQNESINVKSYLSDVGASALIGVFTGGIGSSLGATAATGSILISSSAGAASNLGAKVISELKECTFNNKSWCKFGRNYNNEGRKISGLSAWISTGSVGAITGATGVFSSSIHNVLGRIGVTAVASAAADAAGQGINIVAGNQDKFQPSQTMKTIAVSTCFAAGEEITMKSIHSLNNSHNNHNNRQDSLIQKTNQKQQLIDHNHQHLKHKHLHKYSKHKLKELNSNNHNQINCIISKATGIARGFSLKIIQNKKHSNLTKIKAKKKKILQKKNLKNKIK